MFVSALAAMPMLHGTAGPAGRRRPPGAAPRTHRRDPAPRPRRPAPRDPGLGEIAPASPAYPASHRLTVALDRALRQAGPRTGAVVYDLASRALLFASHATVRRPPASVEKLWTTTALMLELGPGARLRTSVLGVGRLEHGVWHGNLYLRGDGDPTFGDPTFNRFWNRGEGSTASGLVDQLQRLGIRRVTGWVFADESLFDRRRGGLITGYAPDIPDFGGELSALTYDHGTTIRGFSPATFAARELVATMADARIAARASRRAVRTPAAAAVLAAVSSPPLSAMVRLMNVPSDDLFAELLTKQLGARLRGSGSISAGARVISSTIAAHYGLRPAILDGSGLSRHDRSSPAQVVALLRDLWHTAVGREVIESLPTVGIDGTVASIAVRTAAQGRCVAKTGTLNYVTNLAGYCASLGGHPLAFALFVDGPPNGVAIGLESRIVAAIARY